MLNQPNSLPVETESPVRLGWHALWLGGVGLLVVLWVGWWVFIPDVGLDSEYGGSRTTISLDVAPLRLSR